MTKNAAEGFGHEEGQFKWKQAGMEMSAQANLLRM